MIMQFQVEKDCFCHLQTSDDFGATGLFFLELKDGTLEIAV